MLYDSKKMKKNLNLKKSKKTKQKTKNFHSSV